MGMSLPKKEYESEKVLFDKRFSKPLTFEEFIDEIKAIPMPLGDRQLQIESNWMYGLCGQVKRIELVSGSNGVGKEYYILRVN